MKIDLNALESDAGVNLPPYISRSTEPHKDLMHSPEFMRAREIFAKWEQQINFNKGVQHG